MDDISGTGYEGHVHRDLVHKPIPILEVMKILVARAAVQQEWDKAKGLPA